MQNFIKELDSYYIKEKIRNHIEENNKNFLVFYPIKISLFDNMNSNFVIRKAEFTKYLFTRNGARVYFSDADILTMLLQIKEKDTICSLIKSLKELYIGKGKVFGFEINDVKYESVGLPLIHDRQVLENPQDIEISFEDLFILINIILAKDAASIPLWNNKVEFMKHTIVKYILLLKYYYLKDEKVKNYLNKVGYDIHKCIYENYDTKEKRTRNNKIFYDFATIEKSEIL